MSKIVKNVEKKQFDNYYKLIRTYFTVFQNNNTLEVDSEIYIIRNNTVYSTIDNISVINGYLKIQLQGLQRGYLLNVCQCDLIEIRMIYSVLKKKYGKVVTVLN